MKSLSQSAWISSFSLIMKFKYNLTAVGVLKEPPYVNLGRCVSMDCPHPGAEVEFLQNCLRIVNATAWIVPTRMDVDEMIAMLGNGTADITLYTIIQKRERMEKVEFTTPIGLLYAGYYVREIPQVKVVDYLLTSFQLPALLLIIMSSITVAALLYFYTRVFQTSHWSLPRFITTTFCGLLKQYQLNLNGPMCVSILTCAWLWFSFAIIVYYETKIRGLLMLTRYRGSLFTNLDQAMDAMEYHGWKMFIRKGGYSPFSYCRPNQCERLRILQKRSLIQEVSSGISKVVENDKHFAFGALPKDLAPHRKSLIDDSKRILFVRDELITPMYLAFAVRKGMPQLVEELNQAIAIMFNSFATIRGRYRNPYVKYADKQFQKRQTSLTLAHFQVLIQVSWRCFLVAFLLFIGEILYFRYGRLLRSRLNEVHQKFFRKKCVQSYPVTEIELKQGSGIYEQHHSIGNENRRRCIKS